MLATLHGGVEMVKQLVAAGVDVHAQGQVSVHGQTAHGLHD
jgi:hypothetical protein